ncbi:diguanylate cyclase [Candidatus Epulonipiscium fishelsonii]|uniref:Diguanylate cyclase n=1 Tax=Candidatus Epulonipiscium fishelsonii TaxID=77094 RepID=A0ACC8XEZ1_9FIRM|nr:diguanylate cyclase [Epulopiscium sp. SCG-B05WGA-EpuloA1]ONI41925.1 diguanylate cyclase [Epulopiscium sp. SCG-B11WGA-EpuloA1]
MVDPIIFDNIDNMFTSLSDDEKNSEAIAYDSRTFLQDAIKRFKKNKLAVAGLIFIIFIIALAIIVPIVSPYSYEEQNLQARNLLPSAEHLFGTDKLGRDIFVRIMYGARISLSIGFSAAIINLFIGIVYGGIAGYFGGRIDVLMMRAVDIIYSVPTLLYTILILMVFGNSPISMLIAICATSWIGMARQVRTQIMSLKEQEFALAAKVIGASKRRIIFRHLIMNALGPIIVTLTMMVPSAIFTESFLSFVGIGISEPQSSWGLLANASRELIHTHPIQVIWPLTIMSLTILSLNFVGDGLGESLEPRK